MTDETQNVETVSATMATILPRSISFVYWYVYI